MITLALVAVVIVLCVVVRRLTIRVRVLEDQWPTLLRALQPRAASRPHLPPGAEQPDGPPVPHTHTVFRRPT